MHIHRPSSALRVMAKLLLAGFTPMVFAQVASAELNQRGVYTLYLHSNLYQSRRIHVATFDAKESANYNRENCEIAARLFGSQPGIVARYWCEEGRFRP